MSVHFYNFLPYCGLSGVHAGQDALKVICEHAQQSLEALHLLVQRFIFTYKYKCHFLANEWNRNVVNMKISSSWRQISNSAAFSLFSDHKKCHHDFVFRSITQVTSDLMKVKVKSVKTNNETKQKQTNETTFFKQIKDKMICRTPNFVFLLFQCLSFCSASTLPRALFVLESLHSGFFFH